MLNKTKVSTIFVLFLISGCGTVGLMGGGLNSESDYSKDTYLKVGQKVEQKIIAKYAQLNKVNSATIIRGDKKISIDLSNKNDVAKIKNGDLIQLEKGYYLEFPKLTGKSVIIQGVSQNETVIGDIALKKLSLINGENLLFSKLSLNKVFFQRLSDNHENNYSFFQVHINLWQSNKRSPLPVFRS